MVSDKCMGLVEALAKDCPEADWQWCTVRFYRDTWSKVPPAKVKTVAAIRKAIHAQEDLEATRKKAADVVEKLKEMKLPKAARQVSKTIGETLKVTKGWKYEAVSTGFDVVMRGLTMR